jgi:beta-1,4-mannosyltransferase
MFDDPNRESSLLRKLMQTVLRAAVKLHERTMASLADGHLCVTQAMEGWLGENFAVHGKHVRVLYDKPPLLFRPTEVDEQHELFRRLNLENNEGISQWLDEMNESLFFTNASPNPAKTSIRLRDDRPALLVSSTSWTPDEDFSILLKALDKLQTLIDEAHSNTPFPKILVLVTGKGPQKAQFLPLLHEFNKTHSHIKIYTLWLEAIDYPKLLGSATLGISLHTSTSGLDLPMKVLDMFGCQVPVCAIGFDCLSELVKDGINGRIFYDEDELSIQLYEMLDGYPNKTDNQLMNYKKNIRGMVRWRENWDECAHSLIVG